MKNRLIWLLLSLLGLATTVACDGESQTEYGTPYATFSVKGKVTDTNGKGIPGIQISATEGYSTTAVYSDSEGLFDCRWDAWPSVPYATALCFKDIDGAENGEFDSREVSAVFNEQDMIEDSQQSWYHGTYRIRLDVTLTEKQSEKHE